MSSSVLDRVEDIIRIRGNVSFNVFHHPGDVKKWSANLYVNHIKIGTISSRNLSSLYGKIELALSGEFSGDGGGDPPPYTDISLYLKSEYY